ncbi:MAG: DUF805 domain-containing protein [Alphaproteobacteria bacterium]
MVYYFWLVVYIFKNSFSGFKDYQGRTCRLEFWLFQIIYGSLLVLLVASNDRILFFTLIITSITLPSMVACHVRRLHDVEHSGWFLLPKFFYVPWILFGIRALLQDGIWLDDFLFQYADNTQQYIILGLFYCGLIYEIILLVNYFQLGTDGDNIYGKDSIKTLHNNTKNYILHREAEKRSMKKFAKANKK